MSIPTTPDPTIPTTPDPTTPDPTIPTTPDPTIPDPTQPAGAVATIVAQSLTPGANLAIPTNGGVNIALLRQEIAAAFTGRTVWSVNVSDYGATITAALIEPPLPGDPLLLGQVIAAHNPAAQTQGQQYEALAEAARVRLEAVAFAGVITDINQTVLDILRSLGYGQNGGTL